MQEEVPKLRVFEVGSTTYDLKYLRTDQVADGVICDVYQFLGTDEMDLAIIHVAAGHLTPRQLVRSGEATIEGFLSGKGKLFIEGEAGKTRVYEFKSPERGEVVVNVGEKMQWNAAADEGLVIYEICWPPYEDGRFEDLDS